MRAFNHLTLDRSEGLVRLCLQRPRARNALSTELLEELGRALAVLNEDPRVRVLLLEGDGPDFCAGFDLRQLGSQAFSEGLDEALVRKLADTGHQAITALRQARAVTVASVQGHALGGGFLLAAACDLRVISEEASLALPEVDLGLPLIWGGVPLLLDELPPALTRDLLFTGRALDPSRHLFEGFASRTCPPESLEQTTGQLLESLLSKPDRVLGLLKRQALREKRPPQSTAADEFDTATEAILHPEFLPTVMRAVAQRTGSGGE